MCIKGGYEGMCYMVESKSRRCNLREEEEMAEDGSLQKTEEDRIPKKETLSWILVDQDGQLHAFPLENDLKAYINARWSLTHLDTLRHNIEVYQIRILAEYKISVPEPLVAGLVPVTGEGRW
jgi:hypothetical protein